MYNYYPYNERNIEQWNNPNDERFFFFLFVVGGLAGTALGYGIANNNQMNNCPNCPGQMIYSYPVYPYQQSPLYSTNNNYYY